MDANHHRHHHHHHHQKQGREKSVGTKRGPSYDHHHHLDQKSSPPQSSSSSCSKQQQVTISPASPPSASSSPSHEFSFTISLHSSHPTSTTKTTTKDKITATSKSKTQPPPSFAIDLSPADDIFFHGHLLPLHLLSHLPVSPRSSTNYLESFTLPIKDLTSPNDTQKQPTKNIINNRKNSTSTSTFTSTSTSSSSSSSSTTTTTTTTTNTSQKTEPTTKGSSRSNKPKSFSSSFSLFGLRKWRREREDNNIREKPKRKMRFEVSHVLKRYMRMVRPLLFFGRRRDHHNISTSFHLRRQPYSFSGILSPRNNSSTSTSKLDFRGIRRRGDHHQYSAPASMRTSPSNSGLLVATKMATATIHSSASDSTMEELQAAVQAAIAHCKNSIAAEDHKLKC